MAGYKTVDADSHILELLTLWNEYIDPKFRENAPRMLFTEQGGQLRPGSREGECLNRQGADQSPTIPQEAKDVTNPSNVISLRIQRRYIDVFSLDQPNVLAEILPDI
jgi:hypothetical protein